MAGCGAPDEPRLLSAPWLRGQALGALGLASILVQAASFSRHRLPEAFSGYPRSVGRFPVPYPTACSPQAWATGAPLLLVRAMLGLEIRDGKLTVDPDIPDEIGSITITGVPAAGSLWDVHAEGRTGRVEAHVST